MNDFEKPCRKRMRQRSFSCSDVLWEEMESKTKDIISISAFIRNAIKKELFKLENKKL